MVTNNLIFETLMNEEIEQAILGAVLINNSEFDRISAIITADDFFVVKHKWIWQIFGHLRTVGAAIDLLTVSDQLKKQGREQDVGRDYLHKLMAGTVSALDAETYAHVLFRTALRRRLAEAGRRIAQYALDNNHDALQAVEMSEKEIKALTPDIEKTVDIKVEEGADLAADAFLDFYTPDEQKTHYRTGIPGLDSGLGGGFDIGTHNGLLAASGTGKTILLKQIALRLANDGHSVLYILMESKAQYLNRRILAEIMKINPEYLRRSRTPHDPDCPKCRHKTAAEKWLCDCHERYAETFKAKFKQAVDDYSKLKLAILPKVVSVDGWQRDVAIVERRRPIDVLIIDYGQLVSIKGLDTNSEHARFANELSEYAVNHNKIVITALQVRKAGDAGFSSPPTLNDIRGTGGWVNTLSTAIGLWREPVDSTAQQFKDEGIISFLKLRDTAQARSVKLKLFADGLFFGEMA